jgi:hypothetical protein
MPVVVSMMETSVATSDEDAAAAAAAVIAGGGGGVLGSPGGGGGGHALGSPGSGDATGVRCEDAGPAVCTNSPNHSNNIPLGIESSSCSEATVSSHSRLSWPVYDSTPSTVVDHNAGIRSTVAVNLHLPPPPASPTNSIPTAAHSGVN